MSTRPAILEPAALQVLALVAEFLDKELAPAQADARLRYRTRVGADLLRSARRELECAVDLHAEDSDVSQVPAGSAAAGRGLSGLSEDLRTGRRSLLDPDVYELASRLVKHKLAIVMGGD